jgi:hypothetical protein
MVQLDLPRDPTLRITFSDVGEREEANAITTDELARFLSEVMSRHARRHPSMVLAEGRTRHLSAFRLDPVRVLAGCRAPPPQKERCHTSSAGE